MARLAVPIPADRPTAPIPAGFPVALPTAVMIAVVQRAGDRAVPPRPRPPIRVTAAGLVLLVTVSVADRPAVLIRLRPKRFVSLRRRTKSC